MLIGTAPILTHNYAILKAGIFSHVIVSGFTCDEHGKPRK